MYALVVFFNIAVSNWKSNYKIVVFVEMLHFFVIADPDLTYNIMTRCLCQTLLLSSLYPEDLPI